MSAHELPPAAPDNGQQPDAHQQSVGNWSYAEHPGVSPVHEAEIVETPVGNEVAAGVSSADTGRGHYAAHTDEIVDAEIVGEQRYPERHDIPVYDLSTPRRRRPEAAPTHDISVSEQAGTAYRADKAEMVDTRTRAAKARRVIAALHGGEPAAADLVPAAQPTEVRTPDNQTEAEADPDDAEDTSEPFEQERGPRTADEKQMAIELARIAAHMTASHTHVRPNMATVRAAMGAPVIIDPIEREAMLDAYARGDASVIGEERAKNEAAWTVLRELIKQGVLTTGVSERDAELAETAWDDSLLTEFGGVSGSSFAPVSQVYPAQQRRYAKEMENYAKAMDFYRRNRDKDGNEDLVPPTRPAEPGGSFVPEEMAAGLSGYDARSAMLSRIQRTHPSAELMDVFGKPFDRVVTGHDAEGRPTTYEDRSFIKAWFEYGGAPDTFPVNKKKFGAEHLPGTEPAADEQSASNKKESPIKPLSMIGAAYWIDGHIRHELTKTIGFNSHRAFPNAVRAIKGLFGRHPSKMIGREAADRVEAFWNKEGKLGTAQELYGALRYTRGEDEHLKAENKGKKIQPVHYEDDPDAYAKLADRYVGRLEPYAHELPKPGEKWKFKPVMGHIDTYNPKSVSFTQSRWTRDAMVQMLRELDKRATWEEAQRAQRQDDHELVG